MPSPLRYAMRDARCDAMRCASVVPPLPLLVLVQCENCEREVEVECEVDDAIFEDEDDDEEDEQCDRDDDDNHDDGNNRDDTRMLVSCSSCRDDLHIERMCVPCARALHAPARARSHVLTRIRHVMHGSEHATPATTTLCHTCFFLPHRRRRHARTAHIFCDTCRPARALCRPCDARTHRLVNHVRTMLTDERSSGATFSFVWNTHTFTLHTERTLASYAGDVWDRHNLLGTFVRHKLSAAGASEITTRRHTVLELGAGCTGIPSLECVLAGCTDVTCTDREDEALVMLRENATRVLRESSRFSRVTVVDGANDVHADEATLALCPYAFGEPLSRLTAQRRQRRGERAPPPFNLVLGSYILHETSVFAALADTLHQVFAECREAHVWLLSHEPPRERAFLEELVRGQTNVALEVERVEWDGRSVVSVAPVDLARGCSGSQKQHQQQQQLYRQVTILCMRVRDVAGGTT